MERESYPHFWVSDDLLEFIFASVGPNGVIQKVIYFRQTSDPEVFNLTFGDYLQDGRVNDYARSNNGDRDKILSTIAKAIYEFTEMYPNKYVFFRGGTAERNRLYRMAVGIYIKRLRPDFEIYGVEQDGNDFELKPFRRNKDYYGFAVRKKKSKFSI